MNRVLVPAGDDGLASKRVETEIAGLGGPLGAGVLRWVIGTLFALSATWNDDDDDDCDLRAGYEGRWENDRKEPQGACMHARWASRTVMAKQASIHKRFRYIDSFSV